MIEEECSCHLARNTFLSWIKTHYSISIAWLSSCLQKCWINLSQSTGSWRHSHRLEMTSKRRLLWIQNGGTDTDNSRLTEHMTYCYIKTNAERWNTNSRTNDSWWPFRELAVWTQSLVSSHADIHRSRQIGGGRGGQYDYCMWWCCYFFNATPSRSLDNVTTNRFLPRFASLTHQQ